MKHLLKTAIAAAALCAAACTGGDDGGDTRAVPLRYAYPRAAVADTLYSRTSLGPLAFDCNVGAAAPVAAASGRGLDLRYDAYGGSIFLSVNTEDSPAELAAALANRRRRFALNLAGAPARSESFVNAAGFECELVSTGEPLVTPVMFLAHDGRRMLSGAFAFAALAPGATADSLAPTVEALRADAMRLLSSLHDR